MVPRCDAVRLNRKAAHKMKCLVRLVRLTEIDAAAERNQAFSLKAGEQPIPCVVEKGAPFTEPTRGSRFSQVLAK